MIFFTRKLHTLVRFGHKKFESKVELIEETRKGRLVEKLKVVFGGRRIGLNPRN